MALVRLGRQFVLWPIKPSADRRFALSALLLTPVYQVWGAAVARAQSDDLRPIVQPTKKTKAPYLAPARALRDQAVRGGDQAFGAVVVCDGIIVGGCRNYVVLHHDSTARAELLAVRDAAHRLKKRDLSGCDVYSTGDALPPCARAHCIGRASVATITRARRKGALLPS